MKSEVGKKQKAKTNIQHDLDQITNHENRLDPGHQECPPMLNHLMMTLNAHLC